MSEGDRGERSQAVGNAFGILAAIFLVALVVGQLAFVSGRESQRRIDAPHEHAEHAKGRAESSCVGTDPSTVFECVYEQVEASEETARTEQDLDAKQGMKFWTLAMALISAVMALISGIALIFLRDTFTRTRRQADIAREGMIVESRAWLELTVRDFGKLFTQSNPQLALELFCKNTGKSVAHRVRVHSYITTENIMS